MIAALCAVLGGGVAREEPAARVKRIADDMDWSLPAWVKLSPNAGYFGSGDWIVKRRALKRFQCPGLHFAHYVNFSWVKANPAEGVYDREMIEERVRNATSRPHDRFVLLVRCYSRFYFTRWKWARSEEGRRRILETTCTVPQWVIEKGNVHFLSNGAVAAWEPGCGYQKYFGQFPRALGERYRDHRKLVGVDLRGLDCRHGEWCWRGGASVLREAKEDTGLAPETLRAWGVQFVRDYLDAFKGEELKLIWPNSDEVFIPKRGATHDCGPASRAIWRFALSKGCGVRDGMPTAWFRYITPGCGAARSRTTGTWSSMSPT